MPLPARLVIRIYNFAAARVAYFVLLLLSF
jgi:hypothetical protein